MAKKLSKPPVAADEASEQVLEETSKGFPQDGEPYVPDDEDVEDADSGSDDEDSSDDGAESPEEDRFARLEREIAEVRRENENLRRVTAAVQQPAKPAKPEQEEDEDWEELLFRDPKNFAKKIIDKTSADTLKKARSEYNKDQNTKSFWNDFYAAHKDLANDRDLVELTLKSNLDTLADMPSSAAAKKLADLTRERILRYSGGNKGDPKKKVKVEGASPPSGRQTKKQEKEQDEADGQVVPYKRLGDMIKARKRNRARAA